MAKVPRRCIQSERPLHADRRRPWPTCPHGPPVAWTVGQAHAPAVAAADACCVRCSPPSSIVPAWNPQAVSSRRRCSASGRRTPLKSPAVGWRRRARSAAPPRTRAAWYAGSRLRLPSHALVEGGGVLPTGRPTPEPSPAPSGGACSAHGAASRMHFPSSRSARAAGPPARCAAQRRATPARHRHRASYGPRMDCAALCALPSASREKLHAGYQWSTCANTRVFQRAVTQRSPFMLRFATAQHA